MDNLTYGGFKQRQAVLPTTPYVHRTRSSLVCLNLVMFILLVARTRKIANRHPQSGMLIKGEHRMMRASPNDF